MMDIYTLWYYSIIICIIEGIAQLSDLSVQNSALSVLPSGITSKLCPILRFRSIKFFPTHPENFYKNRLTESVYKIAWSLRQWTHWDLSRRATVSEGDADKASTPTSTARDRGDAPEFQEKELKPLTHSAYKDLQIAPKVFCSSLCRFWGGGNTKIFYNLYSQIVISFWRGWSQKSKGSIKFLQLTLLNKLALATKSRRLSGS
jgi:hypothetical protein